MKKRKPKGGYKEQGKLWLKMAVIHQQATKKSLDPRCHSHNPVAVEGFALPYKKNPKTQPNKSCSTPQKKPQTKPNTKPQTK